MTGGAAVWELEGPVPGRPSLTLGRFDLAVHGYAVEEFFLGGTAQAHGAAGAPEASDESRRYRTRILVVRPSSQERFNGTVVVEWLNVSGGGDGAPDWMFMHRHIMRAGMAWVGVSAQKVGVEGGGRMGNAMGGMKQTDPKRYGSLTHPGDAFAFDIFSHAGLAVRGDPRIIGAAPPKLVIGVGESQSAMFLVSYINGVDRVARVYDGFLVHGRGSRGAVRGTAGEEVASNSGDPIDSPRVPTITVQSETDVIGMRGIRARCEDTSTARFWEIAGAAHFDTWGLLVSQEDDGTLTAGRLAELGAPTASPMGLPAEEPVNSGPQQHYVLQAALAHLERWAGGGEGAPHAPFLATATEGERTALVLDELGIARGGIRTPWVEVPTARLSGLGARGEGFAGLFGVTQPFSPEQLAELYPGGRDEYLERFTAAAEAARAAGYLLDDDIDEILALAHASWPM
ncbi:MAG TPA: alpha/beta hydrolase domain-containing protein [Acidimicrobiales bacterium]|nr:alpha/beta hydrolase domain-containing protein [Acidimicrobiales bacterium]